MIDHFAMFDLLLAMRKNAKHRQLVLHFLVAHGILDDGLHLAVHGDQHGLARLLDLLDHVARVRFQESDRLNVLYDVHGASTVDDGIVTRHDQIQHQIQHYPLRRLGGA